MEPDEVKRDPNGLRDTLRGITQLCGLGTVGFLLFKVLDLISRYFPPAN